MPDKQGPTVFSPAFSLFQALDDDGTALHTFVGKNWTVQQAAATHLRKMTGRKIKSAYKHMNQTGAATGQAPYGYRREGKGGPLVIDEEQAAVVRDLFEEYAAGRFSARLLAARLNAQGVAKPGSRSDGLGWCPTL